MQGKAEGRRALVGVSGTLRDVAWVVGPIDARAPQPNRPMTCRKRQVSNRDTIPVRVFSPGISRHCRSAAAAANVIAVAPGRDSA